MDNILTGTLPTFLCYERGILFTVSYSDTLSFLGNSAQEHQRTHCKRLRVKPVSLVFLYYLNYVPVKYHSLFSDQTLVSQIIFLRSFYFKLKYFKIIINNIHFLSISTYIYLQLHTIASCWYIDKYITHFKNVIQISNCTVQLSNNNFKLIIMPNNKCGGYSPVVDVEIRIKGQTPNYAEYYA